MKMFKITAIALSVLALSACGGGGGGNNHIDTKAEPVNKSENINKESTEPSTNNLSNSSQSQNQKTPVSSSNNQSSSKPNNSGAMVNGAKPDTPKEIKSPQNKFNEAVRSLPRGEINEDLKFGKLVGHNNRYSFHGALKRNSSVDTMAVDGVIMELAGLTIGGIKGAPLSNALKSAWNVAFYNPDRNIVYFGDETPASVVDSLKGQATYKGIASRYDNVSREVKNIGASTLNADFDSKKISGELAIDGLRRNISLKETDIKGNQFNGEAIAGENHIFRTVHGKYEGKFFGPNAEEVAGKASFEGEAIIGNGLRDLDTSFSAEKVTK